MLSTGIQLMIEAASDEICAALGEEFAGGIFGVIGGIHVVWADGKSAVHFAVSADEGGKILLEAESMVVKIPCAEELIVVLQGKINGELVEIIALQSEIGKLMRPDNFQILMG